MTVGLVYQRTLLHGITSITAGEAACKVLKLIAEHRHKFHNLNNLEKKQEASRYRRHP